jgi:hypothetical protein
MPPRKQVEPEVEEPEAVTELPEESQIEKLENRVAVLERIVEKLYGHHYGGIRA